MRVKSVNVHDLKVTIPSPQTSFVTAFISFREIFSSFRLQIIKFSIQTVCLFTLHQLYWFCLLARAKCHLLELSSHLSRRWGWTFALKWEVGGFLFPFGFSSPRFNKVARMIYIRQIKINKTAGLRLGQQQNACEIQWNTRTASHLSAHHISPNSWYFINLIYAMIYEMENKSLSKCNHRIRGVANISSPGIIIFMIIFNNTQIGSCFGSRLPLLCRWKDKVLWLCFNRKKINAGEVSVATR